MQLRKLALLGLFGASTAAPTPAVLESTAAALKPEAKEALADNMAESVMSFLVCNTTVCTHGNQCGGHSGWGPQALCQKKQGDDERDEALMVHLSKHMKKLVNQADPLLKSMLAEQPVPGSAPIVDVYPGSIMDQLDESSSTKAALVGKGNKKAAMDVVVVRCDEPVRTRGCSQGRVDAKPSMPSPLLVAHLRSRRAALSSSPH